MAVYTETIKLEDQVSPSAKDAKKALADMTSNLEAAQVQLVKAAALGDRDMFAGAVADIDKYNGAIQKMKGAGITAGGGGGIKDMLGDAAHAAEVGKESIGAAMTSIGNSFRSLAAGDIKGAVTGLFDAVADLSKMLDLVVPGLGQAVSAVIKIAGGLVGVTAGLIQSGIQFAIASTQAKQQMLSMFDAMGDGVGTGEELDEMLSALADQIGISKDTLTPYTKAFLQMGVTGVDALESLTLAAASANAIVGEGGAEAFTNLQKKIQLAAQTGGQIKLDPKFLKMVNASGARIGDLTEGLGLTSEQLKGATVDASKLGDVLSDAIIKRGAGPLSLLSNTFTEIRKKFDQDLGDMFEDMSKEVGPLMTEIKALFGIFAASKPSGEAMKAGIMAFFKETLKIATALVPMVKHFMLDLIIFGLRAYIALKPTILALKEWLASADGIAAQGTAWEILKVALVSIGIAIAVVVGVFAGLAGIMVAIPVLIWSTVAAISAFAIGAVEALASWVMSAPQTAMDFVMGLVNGVTSGGGLLVEAVKGLGSMAIDALTGNWKIASPSKVAMALGANFGESAGMGVEGAASTMTDASSSLATAAVGGMSSPATAATTNGAAPGGGGANVNVYIDGAGKSAEEITDDMVAAAWERMALSQGA